MQKANAFKTNQVIMMNESIKRLILHHNISPNGPEHINPGNKPLPVKAGMPYKKIFAGLAGGQSYCFADTFGTAMGFYSWLKKQLEMKIRVHDYQSSRKNRQIFNTLTKNLLIKISNQRADLLGAPTNGWLDLLHSGKEDYFIRFTDFLGMNGSWQWYVQGIRYPGLSQAVHPFYDVYFPTRNEHLLLFDEWLAGQQTFQHAIDMGTGCGVLTFYMIKHGINHITATDINPNSILSTALDLERMGEAKKTTLSQSALFDGLDTNVVDLLVFNPPWIPAMATDVIDQAIYYDDRFFSDFFDGAHKNLTAHCTLAILFSTFAQAAGISNYHPIEEELKQNRFRLIQHIEAPVQQQPSKRRHWLSELRTREKNELWILQRIV